MAMGRAQGRGSRGKLNQGKIRNGNGGRRGGTMQRSRGKLPSSEDEELEERLGFHLFTNGEPKLGWLMNMSASSVRDSESGQTLSCVNLYFMCQDGSMLKAPMKFEPYFYVATKEKAEMEVDSYLRRRYEGLISNIQLVEKEDLDMKNHLSGLKRKFLKLSFATVQDLVDVKKDLLPLIERSQAKLDAAQAYQSLQQGLANGMPGGTQTQKQMDYSECLMEAREFDVPYHVRFAIDNDIRCGHWFTVSADHGQLRVERREDLVQRGEARVCAFDIETTKLPLKFPDASYDSVMMISYMLDAQGFLIVNREVVGADIEDLEYTPKPEFAGPFRVINVANEKALLERWFDHIRGARPGIFVTYNGDFFDWPFLEQRALHHGLDMHQEIGFRCDSRSGECRSRCANHLDCFAWVKRDSYLPQGSQGLKAVTKAKLGYDPLEVNPEDMVKFAIEKPQTMAAYSVSDAVATYYLYLTYVQPFIFSLSTIIPMPPDEVLRKGSGTLCEMLLMVQAFRGNIICPNKHAAAGARSHAGRMLESETYIGGHVECLESGVFRSDLPTRFRLTPDAFQNLIDKVDADLIYALAEEGHMTPADVSNYDEVKAQICEKLAALRDAPNREERPLIYHLDVAAMYPNIMLTNRLQPPSIVTDDICAACDFNRPGKTCLRPMEWVWRGEHYMATRSDYNYVKDQLEVHKFTDEEGSTKFFRDLPHDKQQALLKDRLKKYCLKVYRRVLDKPMTEARVAGVCQRENPFYIDTVRSFRDRRYEYKGLNKMWKGRLADARQAATPNPIHIQEAQDMVVVYDSLQLAHKCILNSFYGYVMRKGARWYSMEMAGITTYTGAKLIQSARALVEQVGKPLELDTDGIWCCLPVSFPENFDFIPKSKAHKKLSISYPCVMLNADIVKKNTNAQYQTLVAGPRPQYKTSSECSIAFEVDGPYKAMILPASKEEGVLIKKRYAVFNEDGTLAELKGFEMKRRGELKLIKVFQAEVFDNFLEGSTLEECYAAVAAIANRWLDMLQNQGIDLADEELMEYISESSTMSKALEEYEGRKSCAATTARRLADFLGDAMIKDKGLSCQYIIASTPTGAPVSERAIPVAIFNTDIEVRRAYVRKWCKVGIDGDVRSIVDWEYYRMRLSSAIQKIISIPAAMQKVANPVPRVVHPDWLWKSVRDKSDKCQQRSLRDMLTARPPLQTGSPNGQVDQPQPAADVDLEDLGGPVASANGHRVPGGGPSVVVRTYARQARGHTVEEASESAERNEDASVAGGAIGDAEAEFCVAEEERVASPDRREDYASWLEHRKRKWREQRAARKRQRGLDQTLGRERAEVVTGGRQRAARARQAGVGSFFRRHTSLTTSHWQIIQLAPGGRPGEFTAWVLAGDDMYRIPLQVDRKIYLNTRAATPSGTVGEKVTRILPHARPCLNLLEVIVPEEQFLASKGLAAHLDDPDLEGMYETQVPLWLQAVLEVGAVCKVDSRVSNRNASEGWSLAELEFKTTTECPYLPERVESGASGDQSQSRSLTHVFLFHSSAEPRGMYALYTPATAALLVVVANPFANKEVTAQQVERHFRETARAAGVDADPHQALKFSVDFATSAAEAARRIQRALLDYREAHRGPTAALVESPNLSALRTAIPSLGDFPCVNVPHTAKDSNYQALGWQPVAARTAVQRCVFSIPWLKQQIAIAQYAHVPLGNLEPDYIIFMADVFFARQLRHSKQVLWMSESGLVDLGGVADEEEASFADEVQRPELVYPGAYRSICVELKLHHLAVNAMLMSAAIDEMEGRGLLGQDRHAQVGEENGAVTLPPGGRTSYDDVAACGAAFLQLKAMVQAWMEDAVNNGNAFADRLLQHLYRWLCSPLSRLHDPALHRILHKVMQKVFALLLADVRRLGATVVYADFSRIIVATGKHSLPAAQGYCEYLLNTLRGRELFKYMFLSDQRYWHSLLFMDQYNFGGIDATPSGASQGDGEGCEAAAAEGAPAKFNIVSSWNIGDYLPKTLQSYFEIVVSEFLYIPWKHARDTALSKVPQGEGEEEVLGTPSVTVAAMAESEASELQFLKQQIRSYFTEKVLRIVRDTQRELAGGRSKGGRRPGDSSGDEDEDEAKQPQTKAGNAEVAVFPQLAGSHLAMGSPTLEFVKTVCAVLALDSRVAHQVQVLRKQALKLLHVREFAAEAIFRDPCLSFTLPNVICSACNDCRDLDLCRDAQLAAREWRCIMPHCEHPYNREWIENALLQIVRQRCKLYQLQDLKCKKCRQIKGSHLAEQCQCAGEFRCTETPAQFRQRLRVFLNIATFHGFPLLQETVQWLIDAPPQLSYRL